MTVITTPVEVALSCAQGSPFAAVLQFFQDANYATPVNLTGWSFVMQIREGVADSGAPVIASLSSQGSSAGDTGIVFVGTASDGAPDIDGAPDPTNGMIYLKLSSAETSAIRGSKAPKPRAYPAVANFYYDIEATPPSGEAQRIAFGTFDLTLEVTRT